MLKYLNRKIILKLFATVVFSIVITVSGFYIYFNFSSKNDGRVKLKNQIEDLLILSKTANVTPLYNFDIKTINELNSALMRNPMIVAVNIYVSFSFEDRSSNRNQLYTSLYKPDYIKSAKSVIRNSAYTIPAGLKDVSMAGSNILQGTEPIGRIQLFYTDYFMQQEIREAQLNSITTNMILAVLLMAVIFIFLSYYLIRPILNLAEKINEVAVTHEYNLRIEKPFKDEIGVLQTGFNLLLSNIQNREIERDRFEAELNKTKSYLASIIESMPSLLITINNAGEITHFNRSAARVTNLEPAEVIGRQFTQILPVLSDIYLRSKNSQLKDKQPVYLSRQNLGSISKFANISLYPLISEEIQGVVLMVDDVSELEIKEEQLRQVQKMETVGTLAGGLAHDFNNVLSGIVGTLSLLKYKMQKTMTITTDDLKGYLVTMEESAARAVDMVQQLLTLSRRQELIMIPVDLNLAVKHVLKICQNTFDKCVQIHFCQGENNTRILADPTQIEQVILNICVNAYHSMTIMRPENKVQGGTLDLSVTRINADAHFCAIHQEAEKRSYWRLDITDTGIGIDDDTIGKIFEPFFTTKEKGKGTGLGLSMVYNIVKQHKGFVKLYSEVGYGTTFSVYLPVLFNPEVVEESQEENATRSGKGTVLVIDDEEIMRSLVKEMLEECGYSLLFAADGEEGLSIYQDNYADIDLILLDMIMPKKSGVETFHAIRQITPDAKIIVTSGFRQDERVEKLLAKGAAGFIQKPYTINKLSEIIYEAIGK